MAQIALLSEETIDKIAAGEVIERPSSVVKELVENAIDAKASAITVEIKDGGCSMIRITDNGCGIAKDQIELAFLRHSTSKIKSIEDLLCVSSLGFRGEALSSIAAVAQVEVITKEISDLTGIRYVMEGSKEKAKEEIGAPEGTTFLVRNLFYNTPARRKFLKTPQTEGNYISVLMERLALSHPEISFKFINNNATKLHTSGNGNPKDVIFQIYGRDVTSSLLSIEDTNEWFTMKGFIGKPVVSRGNRNFENYFINHRYIKSQIITKGLEDGYKNYLMAHQYPFCVLYFEFAGELLDVNVHPTKMELRFSENEKIYQALYGTIKDRLSHKEHIPSVTLEDQTKEIPKSNTLPKTPEPFEKKRFEAFRAKSGVVREPDVQYQTKNVPQTLRTPVSENVSKPLVQNHNKPATKEASNITNTNSMPETKPDIEKQPISEHTPKPVTNETSDKKETPMIQKAEQLTMSEVFLSEKAKKHHKIIGQLFDTYWLVEFDQKLFIIDQHAAHEKVLYERTLKQLSQKEFDTQMISPPIILSFLHDEEQQYLEYASYFKQLGFEIEHFGGKEYAMTGVPSNLFQLDPKQIVLEVLAEVAELHKAKTPETILDKIASMSCKAAVKGNDRLSLQEAKALIDELLELENPYFCPHGRPTIISMTKYELEKKFKRII